MSIIMATKITHREAEQLSRNYFEKGFVAVTEDGTGFYMDYSESKGHTDVHLSNIRSMLGLITLTLDSHPD